MPRAGRWSLPGENMANLRNPLPEGRGRWDSTTWRPAPGSTDSSGLLWQPAEDADAAPERQADKRWQRSPLRLPKYPRSCRRSAWPFLGAGKMGGILLQAFLKENLFAPELIHGTVQHAERALALSTQWGVDVSTDNLKAVDQAGGRPDPDRREAVPGAGPDRGDQARAYACQDDRLVCRLGEDAAPLKKRRGWRSP
jgi:hypothetical protein